MIRTRARFQTKHRARVSFCISWLLESDEFPDGALRLSPPHARWNTEGLLVKTLLHRSTITVLVIPNNSISAVSSIQSLGQTVRQVLKRKNIRSS